MFLKKGSTEDLIALAIAHGWLKRPPDIFRDRLPPSNLYDKSGHISTIASREIETTSSSTIEIKEPVLIHGESFGLIYEDHIYPLGFCHSPTWLLGDFRNIDLDTLWYRNRRSNIIDVNHANPYVLGIICHWGHFFVDALDRLVKYRDMNCLDNLMLVSDANFFSLNPRLDKNLAVPQVSELIKLLDIKLDSSKIFEIKKNHDYRFECLNFATLEAFKPAVSARNFIALRNYVAKKLTLPSDDQPHALFVGRKIINKRFLLNQEVLIDRIEKLGGANVFPESLPVESSIRAFNSANRVILPIGSAKFNLIFCRPGTRVISIIPKGYAKQGGQALDMLRHICHAADLHCALYEVDVANVQSILLNSDLNISPEDIDVIMSIFDSMN